MRFCDPIFSRRPSALEQQTLLGQGLSIINQSRSW